MNKPSNSQSAHIRDLRNQNIGRLFLRAHRDFQMRSWPKLNARGHDTLSPAHINILIFLDASGTRITKLAERAEMTKQSASTLIHDLEAKGYVTREPDPQDGRASIIHFSDLGRKFLEDASHVKQEIEAEYAAILGEESFAQLHTLLAHLLEHSKEDGQIS